MKKLLLILTIFFLPSLAWAQCNGLFPPSTVCGNSSLLSNAPPGPVTIPSGTGGVNSAQINAGTSIGISGVCDTTTALNCTVSLLAPLCLNIVDYGGSGNNFTDNVTPFTNALAALTGTGGCIYFPPGKYRFLSAITYNIPAGPFSVSVVGSGTPSTTLFWPNAAGGMTINYSSDKHSFNWSNVSITTGVTNGGIALNYVNTILLGNFPTTSFYNMVISGDDGGVATDYWTTGIKTTGISAVSFNKVTVFGSSGNLGDGLSINGNASVSPFYSIVQNITECSFFSTNNGIIYGSYVQGMVIDRSQFTNGTVGVNQPAAVSGIETQLNIVNSQFNVTTDAVQISTRMEDLFFDNNLVFVPPNHSGVVGVEVEHFTITNNQFNATGGTMHFGVFITTTVVPGNIVGNTFQGLQTGVQLNGSVQGVLVANNTFVNMVGTVIINNGTNNVIRDNPGYNPVGPANISVSASPFTYSSGATPETVYIWGGTVSSVTFDKVGGALTVVACASSPCQVQLGPYESTKVTYSATPNMNKMVH